MKEDLRQTGLTIDDCRRVFRNFDSWMEKHPDHQLLRALDPEAEKQAQRRSFINSVYQTTAEVSQTTQAIRAITEEITTMVKQRRGK